MTGRQRAVIIGGGIAGVAAARVLADRFAEVIVLERDPEVAPRPHVPQLAQTHILGAHGYRLLCRWFPGFDAELAAGGAPTFDYGECPYFVGEWAPRGPYGLVSRSCTRPLLETVLRRCLAMHGNVSFRTNQRVRGFALADDRVTAVRLDREELAADLVVDASGIGSKTTDWLADHGYPSPPKTELDLRGAVASQLFLPAADRRADWVLMNVRRTPEIQRAGVISCVEHGLWRVSLWGVAGNRPPKDPAGFLAYARSLAHPMIAELLENAEPVAPPSAYTNAWTRWIHFEKLARFPDGLAVIGDASFHPNYEHGQGITFCAMAAEHLGAYLDRGDGSSLQFQRDLATMLEPWWDWNVSTELLIPSICAQPAAPSAMARHQLYRELRESAITDGDRWRTCLEVTQAVRSPLSLL